MQELYTHAAFFRVFGLTVSKLHESELYLDIKT